MQRANLGDHKKGAPRVLATSPTLEGIKEHIASYFACDPKDVQIEGERILIVMDYIASCRVVPGRGGYRFEAVPPKD